MSEVSGPDEFVVEPMTDLAGTPVSAKRRPGFAHPPGWLGQPGLVALAEGLALLVCFFFPWFFFPRIGSSSGPNGRPIADDYSGWATAIGVPAGGPQSSLLALFVHLWLVPITAVALLVLVWLYVQRRVSPRLLLGTTIALSVLALLVELGFYVEVASLASPGNNNSQPPSFGIVWGFWGAMVIDVIAVVVCAYLLRAGRELSAD